MRDLQYGLRTFERQRWLLWGEALHFNRAIGPGDAGQDVRQRAAQAVDVNRLTLEPALAGDLPALEVRGNLDGRRGLGEVAAVGRQLEVEAEAAVTCSWDFQRTAKCPVMLSASSR